MTQGEVININELRCHFFDQTTVHHFIEFLKEKAIVVAPHKKGVTSYAYAEVTDVTDVIMNYPRTIQPLKKYFLPPKETLLTFDIANNKFTTPQSQPQKRIFFAIHAYELEAIRLLDFSFEKDNPESNYFTKRQDSLFIGISFTPDRWHFSKSIGIEIEKLEGFSLFFEPVENGYLVLEVDEEGRQLMMEFGSGVDVDTISEFELQEKHFPSKLKYHHNRIPVIFDHIYQSAVWEDVASRCVGCGTCTIICPTCFCFDIRDEVELNMTDGSRDRYWDSCMLNQFAEVAGGENFREHLSSRTRHRLFRKFKYQTEHSGKIHCIGCGRCSRYCPAEINIVEIVNALIEDFNEKQQNQAI